MKFTAIIENKKTAFTIKDFRYALDSFKRSVLQNIRAVARLISQKDIISFYGDNPTLIETALGDAEVITLNNKNITCLVRGEIKKVPTKEINVLCLTYIYEDLERLSLDKQMS